MSLFSWNCRGVGNDVTVWELRKFARKFAPTVLGIGQTQISKDRVEALAPSLGYDCSFVVGSSGRSGELGLFWNKEIKLEIFSYSCYHIDAKVEGLGPLVFRVTLVYANAQVEDRYMTWISSRISVVTMILHGSSSEISMKYW